MKNLKHYLHRIAYAFLIVGGIAWLLFTLFGWEIGMLFNADGGGVIATIIYLIIGAAAIYELVTHKHRCAECVSEIDAPAYPRGTTPESRTGRTEDDDDRPTHEKVRA